MTGPSKLTRWAMSGLLLAMASVSLAASELLTAHTHAIPFEQAASAMNQVPQNFGKWREIPDTTVPINPARPDGFGRPGQTYDKIVSRTYLAPDGTQIMLMLAYQREQRQEDRVHSPELCYYGQGFVLQGNRNVKVPLGNRLIPARAFSAVSLERQEDVVYWIRTGNELRPDAVSTRLEIFKSGVKGRIDDGILVRVSTTDLAGPSRSAAEKQALLTRFLSELATASPANTQAILAGHARI